MPLEKTTNQIWVFRVQRPGKGWFYVNKGYSDLIYHEDPRLGKLFKLDHIEDILNFYQMIMRDNKIDNVQFVKVVIETTVDEVSLNEGDFLEERRRRALLKLNESDIRVLGLDEIATYNKLKFHGEK